MMCSTIPCVVNIHFWTIVTVDGAKWITFDPISQKLNIFRS